MIVFNNNNNNNNIIIIIGLEREGREPSLDILDVWGQPELHETLFQKEKDYAFFLKVSFRNNQIF